LPTHFFFALGPALTFSFLAATIFSVPPVAQALPMRLNRVLVFYTQSKICFPSFLTIFLRCVFFISPYHGERVGLFFLCPHFFSDWYTPFPFSPFWLCDGVCALVFFLRPQFSAVLLLHFLSTERGTVPSFSFLCPALTPFSPSTPHRSRQLFPPAIMSTGIR